MTEQLIARLEAATEGSRELSDEVLLALEWSIDFNGWWHEPGAVHASSEERPSPTQSVDDALGLLGKNYAGLLEIGKPEDERFGCQLYRDGSGFPCADEWAKTEALALCAAILRSRAQAQDNPER